MSKLARVNAHFTKTVWHGRRVMFLLRRVFEGYSNKSAFQYELMNSHKAASRRDPSNRFRAQLLETGSYDNVDINFIALYNACGVAQGTPRSNAQLEEKRGTACRSKARMLSK